MIILFPHNSIFHPKLSITFISEQERTHSSLPPSTSNPHVSTSHPYIHSMYSWSYFNRRDSIPLLNCPSQSRFSFYQYTSESTTALSPPVTTHSSQSQFHLLCEEYSLTTLLSSSLLSLSISFVKSRNAGLFEVWGYFPLCVSRIQF